MQQEAASRAAGHTARLERAAGPAPVRPAVRVSALTKRFGTSIVLDRIDLDIEPGSAVALIGANGAGKSTLLRSLVRLVEPTAGLIEVLDREVTGLNAAELGRLRSRVGVVFQRHNLVPRLSALSNVLHGVQARARGPRTWVHTLARPEHRDEAMSCLEAVGLADKASQRSDSLSGGQSQRVAIARMLMQRPELILADEPDASLDPRSGREVMELLHGLAKRRGLTLVFVSHRMAHAIGFADRVVGIQEGRIALDQAAAASNEVQLATFFAERNS